MRGIGQFARPCLACGTWFTPRRADADYCSPACRQRAYRRRVTERERPRPIRNGAHADACPLNLAAARP